MIGPVAAAAVDRLADALQPLLLATSSEFVRDVRSMIGDVAQAARLEGIAEGSERATGRAAERAAQAALEVS